MDSYHGHSSILKDRQQYSTPYNPVNGQTNSYVENRRYSLGQGQLPVIIEEGKSNLLNSQNQIPAVTLRHSNYLIPTGNPPAVGNQPALNQPIYNQLGANQLGANQLGANQLGANQLGVNQLGANQLGANQLGVNQLGVNQLGVNQLGVNSLGVNPLGVWVSIN